MTTPPGTPVAAVDRGLSRAAAGAFALGFALSGFFDGILLHQVLQWHHLLSGIDAIRADLRLQVLADGAFHAAMYGVAAFGLGRLWGARGALGGAAAGRRLIAAALAGFGAWTVLDILAVHWLLGLHRLRLDVGNPFLWDLGWLAAFGAAPLAAAALVSRGRATGPGRGVAAALALGAIGAGAVAARPPPPAPGGATVVAFAPWVSPVEALAAVAEAGGRPLWSDRSGAVWAVAAPEGPPEGPDGAIPRVRGAWIVSGRAGVAACLGWSRPAT